MGSPDAEEGVEEMPAWPPSFPQMDCMLTPSPAQTRVVNNKRVCHGLWDGQSTFLWRAGVEKNDKENCLGPSISSCRHLLCQRQLLGTGLGDRTQGHGKESVSP